MLVLDDDDDDDDHEFDDDNDAADEEDPPRLASVGGAATAAAATPWSVFGWPEPDDSSSSRRRVGCTSAVDLVDIEVPMTAPADAAVAPKCSARRSPRRDDRRPRARGCSRPPRRNGSATLSMVGSTARVQKAKQYVKLAAGLD